MLREGSVQPARFDFSANAAASDGDRTMSALSTLERTTAAPIVTDMTVIPVAGHDSMLLNLSGAHAPFFTLNIVILKDSSCRTRVSEVAGGEVVRQTLDDANDLIV